MKYTEEQAAEYLRCADDIEYFAERYVKIRTVYVQDSKLIVLNDFQRRTIQNFKSTKEFFSLEERMAGKTTIAAIIILHQSIFREYFTSGIFAWNMNSGQYILELIYDMYENLPEFLTYGSAISQRNKLNVEFENFASIRCFGSNVCSARGRTINLVYLDEYEFIKNKEEIEEYIRPYLSSINSKVLGLSTAKPIFTEAEGVLA